jgi:hypothetical protein
VTARVLVVIACAVGVVFCGLAIVLFRRDESKDVAEWFSFKMAIIAVVLFAIGVSVSVRGASSLTMRALPEPSV